MSFAKYLSGTFDLMPTTVAENVGQFLSNAFLRRKQQVKELLEIVEIDRICRCQN
jgi:hypothetical protein